MTSLTALIFMCYNIWTDYEAVLGLLKCIKIMQYLQFSTSKLIIDMHFFKEVKEK